MGAHRPDFRTVENFRDFVEAIEIARDFLVANTPQKVRLALIALDNIAELLMTQIAREIFREDEIFAKIIRPRFSRKLKKTTLWEFGAKTELMKTDLIVGESEAALLNLGHDYRNPAFHQGRHNPRAVLALSIMLMQPIATLLRRAFSGVQIGGMGDIAWLRNYSVSTEPLTFEEAVPKIIARLGNGLREPLDRVEEALSEDITIRLDALDQILNDEWYALKAKEWNDVIKHVQFVESFDDAAASVEYRELVYEILDRTKDMTADQVRQLRPDDPISRDDLHRAKVAYDARRAAALSSFRPTFVISELEQLRENIASLKKAGSETALILGYRDLDQRLVIAEDAILAARALVDEGIQIATDVARGK